VGLYIRIWYCKIYKATIPISLDNSIRPSQNHQYFPLFLKISNVNFFYWSEPMTPNFVGLYISIWYCKIYKATIPISLDNSIRPSQNHQYFPLFLKISNVNFFYWSEPMTPNFVGLYISIWYCKIYKATIPISSDNGDRPSQNHQYFPLFLKISNVNFFYWSEPMTPNFVGLYISIWYCKIYKATIPISSDNGDRPSQNHQYFPLFLKISMVIFFYWSEPMTPNFVGLYISIWYCKIYKATIPISSDNGDRPSQNHQYFPLFLKISMVIFFYWSEPMTPNFVGLYISIWYCKIYKATIPISSDNGDRPFQKHQYFLLFLKISMVIFFYWSEPMTPNFVGLYISIWYCKIYKATIPISSDNGDRPFQ